MRSRKIFLLITPLVSILVTLLLAELALAVFYPAPYAMERNMYFEADPYTGTRLKANSTGGYYNDISANANSHGHRDQDVSLHKPDGIFRIMIIGDSFTVGANVEERDAYPSVLEELLTQQVSPKIEVINTGIGGHSPWQYAQYLEHYGLEFKPDLVVVGLFVGNDVIVDRFSLEQTQTAVMGRRIRRESAADPLIETKVFLYENSHIARMYMNLGVPVNIDFRRQACDDFIPIYITIQSRRLPVHLREMNESNAALAAKSIEQIVRMSDLATANGSELVVVLIPDENQLNPDLQKQVIEAGTEDDYDFSMPQSMLRDAFAAEDIPVIDLLRAFRDDPRCMYMNETHWTPQGHKLAAQRIFYGLMKLDIL
jgi:hypothetical protein